MFLGVESKPSHPFLCRLGAYGLQDPDGDHVLGLRQARAHAHGAVVLAVVVLGLPGLAAGDTRIEEQRGVVDHSGRGEAFFKRRRVNEGLEAGARLAPGLRRMVELVLVEVEATHQCADGTVARVQGHKSAFHFGQLCNLPGAFGCLDHTDHGATPYLDVRGGLVAEAGLRRLQPIACDLHRIPVGTGGQDAFGGCLQHHRGEHVPVVRMVCQCVINGVFHLLGAGRQRHKLFWPPVLLAPFVVHDPTPQSHIGRLLFCGVKGGVHIETACVGLVAVLGKDQLAGHFRHVFSVDAGVVGPRADLQFLFLGLLCLLRSDEAVFFHPLDDVLLTSAGTLRIADGVVRGWSLGQTGKHCSFGDRDGFERFTKISFRGCRKTVSTIAEENLIHVNLKNLILGQQMFQFKG